MKKRRKKDQSKRLGLRKRPSQTGPEAHLALLFAPLLNSGWSRDRAQHVLQKAGWWFG